MEVIPVFELCYITLSFIHAHATDTYCVCTLLIDMTIKSIKKILTETYNLKPEKALAKQLIHACFDKNS